MKKILSIVIMFLIVLPAISVFTPQVKASVTTLTTLKINTFDESGFPPASDNGFTPIAEVKIEIYDVEENLIASDKTGDDGSVTFNLDLGTYTIEYGGCLVRSPTSPTTDLMYYHPILPNSTEVTVISGTNEVDLHVASLLWHVYKWGSDGGDPFELNYFDLDSDTPEYEESISVSPGQAVQAKASFWELETVNVPVWYASVFGEWNPTTSIANLVSGCASPSSHNLHTIPFSFTAPTKPGTYHIRLNGVLDYDWATSYYTGGHPNPNLGRDMGIGIISNLEIDTETKDITGTYGVGTIVVGAETPSVQEFWVPLTLPQGWSANDFDSDIFIVALQDSVFTVDGGTAISLSADQTYLYPNPSSRSHVVVQSGCIMAFYRWFINDYGIWDDGPLGYTLLPAFKLGTSYLIPIGGTVGVVATEPSTTVYYSGSPDPVYLEDARHSVQFDLSDGSWVEADKPIAVAVGNIDISTKSDTWGYAPFPNNFIDTSYHFGKRVPMDPSFPNQVAQSKIAVMATDLGANVEINGVAQPPLGSREFMTLTNPNDDIQISSDTPVSVVYLQKIRHDDPWTGELRYTSYAQSLIPKDYWGKSFWILGLLKTHLITEETVNVETDSTSQQYQPGVYDLGELSRGTILTSDKPVAIEQVGASDWAGMQYHPQGEAYETFPTDFYTTTQPDFEISVSPRRQTAQPESSVEYKITVTSENGFSSLVTLNAEVSTSPGIHLDWTIDPYLVTPPPNGEIKSKLRVNIYDDTPLSTFTFTVTASSEGITPKHVEVRLYVEKSLEVPFQGQDGTQWCGGSALAMVLHYYGILFHSWDYAEAKQEGTQEGTSLDELFDFVQANYYPSVIPKKGIYKSKNEVRDNIETYIYNGSPAILRLVNSAGFGHAIVVIGFNETGFFVNDPGEGTLTERYGVPFTGKYNHQFVDWKTLVQFVETSSLFKSITSFVALEGIQQPLTSSGTIYPQYTTDINFHDPADSPLAGHECYRLYPNQGLIWNYAKSEPDGSSEEDNIIKSKCSGLFIRVMVSNSRSTTQSFTLYFDILGPDGVVYSAPAKSIDNLEAFSQKPITLDPIDMSQKLTEGVVYQLGFYLYDSNDNLVDYFRSPRFYWVQGIKIEFSEKQQHLYLHVYDSQGNHVGLNYTTNQTELGIPGSYYHDNWNGTTIVIIPQIRDLTIVVDGEFAEEPVESYNLTVNLITNLGVSSQTYLGNIAAGERQTFIAEVSGTELTLHTSAPTHLWIYFVLTGAFVAAAIVVFFAVGKSKKKHSNSLIQQKKQLK